MKKLISVILLIFSIAHLWSEQPQIQVRNNIAEKDGIFTVECSRGDGLLQSSGSLGKGLYVFRAEVRHTGFSTNGKFAIDVKSPDFKKSYSNYEFSSVSSEWSFCAVYFRLTGEETIMIRLGNWQGKKSAPRMELRNLSVKPYVLESEHELLVNSDLEKGVVGGRPLMWHVRKEPSEGTIELHNNTSFKSGRHVLKFTDTGKGDTDLRSSSFPLPSKGEIEFSAWAKTDVPEAHVTLHIVCDGWNPRVEGGGQVTPVWKQISAKINVPTDGKKKWFFLKITPKVQGTVEIAKLSLKWYPEGKKNESGKEEAWLGWQGVPGNNLLYNPDFELGGTGYFYDFSWPKEMKHYESIRKSAPITFAQGKGVDGGTCARIEGPSTVLRAYCFPVTVGKTYTISADLRALEGASNAECQVLSFDPEWKCALWKKATGIPGDSWKRYHWTLTWKNHNIQKRGYVRFGSDTGVLVDRIQVVEGTNAEYEPPAVMVGLVFDRWQYFVRGKDKAQAKIKVVPGVKKEGTCAVAVTARDAWGNEVWSRAFDAPLDKETLVPVDLPTEKCGLIHVDLKTETNGTVSGIGIARYAIIDPPNLQERKPGKPGLFGICQETFNYPVWLCEDHAQIHTDLGVRINRFFASVPKDLTFPIPESFKADLRAKCAPFNKAGIDLMPCVGLIPNQTAKACAAVNMPKKEDFETYEKYFRSYIQGLKGKVEYIEIFNEPNLWRVGSGPDKGKSTMYPEKYFEFQKIAYRVVREVDPDMKVVCNALNNLPWDWIDTWMKLGAGQYMDVFSFHPYGWTNFYSAAIKLRNKLKEHGFTKPAVNSEKYFGCNIFYERNGYEETRRGYYLPHNEELRTAGRSIRHFISHAADRVTYCPFSPFGTLFRRCPGSEIFLYDFFPAYNAATRFLVPAGRGEELDLGPSLTAFIFPNASGGPLMAVWTPLARVEAFMQGLEGNFTVYDIMGNRMSEKDLKIGIRVANDPAYIRYAPGTSSSDIREYISKADVVGLGDPFKVDLAITGAKQISAMITSCRNKPLSGTVKLLDMPKEWRVSEKEKTFSDLGPGGYTRVDFTFNEMKVENLAEYTVSMMAESGDSFLRKDVILRPLFASFQNSAKADGDLAEWKGAGWINLGPERLSKNFNPELSHTGNNDLSAKLACGWNDTDFFLAVRVRDDVFKTSQSERMGWEADSIQVYFDPHNDASSTTGARTSEDVSYTVALISGKPVAWVDKGAESNFKGEANKAEGFNDVDVRCAVVRKGNETVYEIAFNRLKCIPGAVLKEGGNMGFSVLINDNDGKGRKQGLTLAPRGSQPYGAPHEFRDLLFRK